MLEEGKTMEEMARMTQVDKETVRKMVKTLSREKFAEKSAKGSPTVTPAIPPPAETPPLVVGEITFSSLKWGWQTATFEVTNNSGDVKFIAAEIDVQFKGTYLNPHRRTRKNYILQPSESKTLSPSLYIPGNYGVAEVVVSLYDVVDTLDLLLPGQRFFRQTFSINFSIPDEMLPYMSEKVTMPPRVESHPDFDNEFSRVVPFLLNEDKTPARIAAMAMTDTAYVTEIVQAMLAKGYLIEQDGRYKTTFPTITVPEAEQAKKIAVHLADTLTALIKNNMHDYRRVLDSLIAAGMVDKDSNAFYDGGVVLYHPYPVVTALVLWFDLGQQFITGTDPLLIYDGTDLCNAHIPRYLYAVQGGAVFNGRHFYALFMGQDYQIFFGDTVPQLDCPSDYILKAKLHQKVDWRYAADFLPEHFVLDTAVVRPMLERLAEGADQLLADANSQLREVAVKHGHRELDRGERYWFWNLVASRTVKKLTDDGIITRRGNGQYAFFGIKSR